MLNEDDAGEKGDGTGEERELWGEKDVFVGFNLGVWRTRPGGRRESIV